MACIWAICRTRRHVFLTIFTDDVLSRFHFVFLFSTLRRLFLSSKTERNSQKFECLDLRLLYCFRLRLLIRLDLTAPLHYAFLKVGKIPRCQIIPNSYGIARAVSTFQGMFSKKHNLKVTFRCDLLKICALIFLEVEGVGKNISFDFHPSPARVDRADKFCLDTNSRLFRHRKIVTLSSLGCACKFRVA